MATYIAGSGGGGKGGGGSARVAVEAPNTLKSKSYAKIVEVLCEGEIEGLVSGAQSIFLDGTPLQNQDGTFNYDDVVIETREGTLSQGVTKIGGTTESTVSVGTEVKQSVPVLHTITSQDVDRVRVAIRLPVLSEQNTSNGDLGGSSVTLKIEYNPNGTGWISAPVGSTTVPISPTFFTGVTYISGAALLSSAFTTETYCTGREGNNCRVVKKYVPSTLVLQFNENNGGWVTFGGADFVGENQTIPFSLAVSSSASYQIRAVLSSGTGGISYLNGSYSSGEVTISGKTTSPYERDYEFSLTGDAPWVVRVTRLTADSVSSAIQNKTYLSSVTSVFEEKFRYPATAYVALSIDAEQFSNIPSRAYDVKLLKIRVPVNYDPVARTYSGVWNGTFKIAWSDNPAWCFYDLITSKRYGLGERIDESQVDKWALYDIAQYCDELVDDGSGALEPRFTCNVLIQTREDAYKVLQDMASIFAGTTYWGSSGEGFQGIVPVQDKPQETYAYVFNNSNVIDGVFSYQTANNNTQFNTVYVTYNDPLDEYKQKVVYVSDDEAISVDGYANETNVVAFGCTSKAQAIRLGRRVLYTNKYENDIVSFSVGADGAIPSIGSIVQVSDELRSGERLGGRVVDTLSTTSVKVDREFVLLSDVTYKLSLIDSSGAWQEVVVTNSPSTTDVLTFTPALPDGLSKNSPFILSNSASSPVLYKVVSNTETDQHVYSVSAVKHIPEKYGYIDDLIPIPELQDTSASLLDPVTDLSFVEVLYSDGVNVKSKLAVSWTPAKFSSRYTVSYRKENNNSVTVSTTTPSIEILDTGIGKYVISVVSTTILGQSSPAATLEVDVVGKIAPPSAVINFAVAAFSNSAVATWDLHQDLDVTVGGYIEIKHTSKVSGYKWEDGQLLATVAGSATSATIPLLDGTYMAKALDSSGVYSVQPAYSDSNFAKLQVLNVIATSVQQPDWNGVKTNIFNTEGYLTLSSVASIDSIFTLIDEIYDFDSLDAEIFSEGTYEFDTYIDVGNIVTSRTTSNLEYAAFDIADTIDSRTETIDTWPLFDGADVNTTFAQLYISTTEDDPSSMSAVWTPWKKFVVADYRARGFKFKIEVVNQVPTHNIQITKAEVSIDVPDRVEGAENIVCPIAGYSVSYSTPFFEKPSVAIRIDNMQSGDYYEISPNTTAGFTIKFKDATNTYVSRQFDFISKGIGYVLI